MWRWRDNDDNIEDYSSHSSNDYWHYRVGRKSCSNYHISATIEDKCAHPFNGPLSRTTQVRWYQKGKTNLGFTEARDSEWQLHQLGRMQVCSSLQTDNHTSTPPLSFLQAGCLSCRPTNIIKALKARQNETDFTKMFLEFLRIKIQLQFLFSC